MNKDKIIELYKSGAFYSVADGRLYHPSFRKGYRKLTPGNISLVAAAKALGTELQYDRETGRCAYYASQTN